MKRKYLLIGGVLVAFLILGVMLVVFPNRTLTLTIDGADFTVDSMSPTVGGVLNDAGVSITTLDQVIPAANGWLGSQTVIEVEHARPVYLCVSGQDQLTSLWSTSRVPKDWLTQASISLPDGGVLYWNGAQVGASDELPYRASYTLQIVAPVEFTLRDASGKTSSIVSTQNTLGGALWDAGLRFSPADNLSLPFDQPVAEGQTVSLRQAVSFTISSDGQQISAQSAAATVGQALADAGISLQGLDYSLPTEDQPLTAGAEIQVIRVREEVNLEQSSIAFENEYVADPDLELDSQAVVEAGQPGLKITRVRVRYENGQEVSRTPENEWTASEPKNQKVGYGTKVVIRTLQTSDGTIEYYRAVRVYATSYAPCKFYNRCSYITASGRTLQKGVIGTGPTWYNLFAGQSVYVANYGTGVIADWGNVPGYWLDLGYSDADYVAWASYTTVYFLTPVPTNIQWILPK